VFMKNIEWQDDRDIYGRMLLLTDSYMFNGLRNAVDHYDADFTDALTWGQLKSKRWLLRELHNCNIKQLGTVFLCAGWYAILASMLFEDDFDIDRILSFDIDVDCVPIAETINKKYVSKDWKFKALHHDIHDITYKDFSWTFWSVKNNRMSYPITDSANTIINTSCEHIDNFRLWYDYLPSDALLVLQTNNYFEIEDHINCSESLEHFTEVTPLSNVLYEGELHLGKYTRYMRIGYR